MRPVRDPADVLRSIGRRKARAARRWSPEEPFASTDPDPRTEWPLERRDAVVETLRCGTVLTTYVDKPLSAVAPPAAAEVAADEPRSLDEERSSTPPSPPTAAPPGEEAEKAARWRQFATHSGLPDDHRR